MSSTVTIFKDLYLQVCAETKTHLNEKTLQSIFTTFPSLIVADCDGNFDKDEKGYLLNISKNLVPEDINVDEEKELCVAEIYSVSISLLLNKDKWEDKIFNLIRSEINNSPDDKELIESMMLGMASASEGINKIEEQTINRIREKLF